jgi:hypothetical protein
MQHNPAGLANKGEAIALRGPERSGPWDADILLGNEPITAATVNVVVHCGGDRQLGIAVDASPLHHQAIMRHSEFSRLYSAERMQTQ